MKNLSRTIAALLLCLPCLALPAGSLSLTPSPLSNPQHSAGRHFGVMAIMPQHHNTSTPALYPATRACSDEGRTTPPVLAEPPSSSPFTIRAPFRLAGRLIIVQAEIDGQKGNFILDTGAEKLVINERHFGKGWRDARSTKAGMLGNVAEGHSCRLINLAWQGMSFKKVKADVVDLSHLEEQKNFPILGLIGYEIVKDYELLIDFQQRQIVLTRTNETGERLDNLAAIAPPVDSLPFSLARHMAVLDGDINGHGVAFGLDSGAEYNLLNRKAGREVLSNFEAMQHAAIHDAGGRASTELPAGRLYQLNIQNLSCSGMPTVLMNMDNLNRLLQSRLDGVLGAEFLATRRTIINYKKKKLYFLEWE
ncbi:MAG: retropepsin-like domain-containing protein [Phaeodactylibacter sp.]|nr:retropepsin-like domain-containing protein [Phaeodactylibacter sp.]MCB9267800.1 retropepsin-like domain-containing protein [Lewinellaceae bacterium]MCB9297210.1 retropepsin-like domain-containing protein [Lewinellaceae bacterium]